jgi:hypothetical protein
MNAAMRHPESQSGNGQHNEQDNAFLKGDFCRTVRCLKNVDFVVVFPEDARSGSPLAGLSQES